MHGFIESSRYENWCCRPFRRVSQSALIAAASLFMLNRAFYNEWYNRTGCSILFCLQEISNFSKILQYVNNMVKFSLSVCDSTKCFSLTLFRVSLILSKCVKTCSWRRTYEVSFGTGILADKAWLRWLDLGDKAQIDFALLNAVGLFYRPIIPCIPCEQLTEVDELHIKH